MVVRRKGLEAAGRRDGLQTAGVTKITNPSKPHLLHLSLELLRSLIFVTSVTRLHALTRPSI